MTFAPGDLGTYLQYGGAAGVLIFMVAAFIKGWVVPGSIYRSLVRDRDEWKEIALTSIRTAERGVGAAEQGLEVVRRSPRRPRVGT